MGIRLVLYMGRVGADNIRRLDNIMWEMADLNSPVAAISLDAEKAFDWNGVIYLRH